MDSILNLLVGDLVLAPEFMFVARCIALTLVVEGFTALLSAIVPIARIH